MNLSMIALAWLSVAPEVQRPRSVDAAPATAPDAVEVAPVVTEEPEPEPEPQPEAEPEPEAQPASTETFRVVGGNGEGAPPYYTDADMAAVRRRHGIAADPGPDNRKVRWRCLIADPLCGLTIEGQAMGALAPRFRQGDVRERKARKWVSGRAQYDVWVNLPVLTEARGRTRYTRMTLGPKAGVVFSDTGDTWGNLGLVGRYWMGRGRFAPAIEFTSALAFKIARRRTDDLGGAAPKYEMQRGPVGISADVGLSIGGFAALVFGGQYDSPLAREDVPERFRTQAGGMLYLGIRGNILWGAPAAAAVATHGLTQRYGRDPN